LNSPLASLKSTEPVLVQVNGNFLDVGGPIRLNLGGMGEGFVDGRIDGFKIVDLREGSDFKRDASDLSCFSDCSVETIYASNILEHWSLNKTVDVLKEWNRVLKVGCYLYISVPDFHRAVELYQKHGLTEWLRYHLWGDQKHPLNYHYTCFTLASLSKDLIDAGFRDVKRMSSWPFIVNDGSQNRDSIEGKFISLNVGAVK
jgi:predicted SAM-dependent methyltransferase